MWADAHKLPRFCQRDPRGSQTSTSRSTLHAPTFIHANVSSHRLAVFKTHLRGPAWDFFFSFCPAFFTARCLLRTSFLGAPPKRPHGHLVLGDWGRLVV